MRSTDVVESLYVMELAYAAPDRELDRQCPVGRSVGGYPLQGRGFRRAHIGRGVIVRVRLPERSHEVVNKHKSGIRSPHKSHMRRTARPDWAG